MSRFIPLLVILALVAAACADRSSSDPTAAESAEVSGNTENTAGEATTSTIEDYPDAQTRALAARARERRPVEDSALPPRHLEPERHPDSLVDRYLIVSGGPPPDGIPSIDTPTFSAAATVDWLADEEPVAVLTIDGRTRIYPAQILIWHEIVNDNFDGRPITMTYCPLCNSVVAFDATVTAPDGSDLVLDFGTSGALYQSALVMYDRQTESLWTHFDGLAVIGTMRGTELTILPAAMVSWVDARAAHPDAQVLDRPTGRLARPYGTVPYPNYETAPPASGYITDETDDRLEPKQRVVGLSLGGQRIAINRRTLEADRVITVSPADTDSAADAPNATADDADSAAAEADGDGGGQTIVVLWEPGTASALDGRQIADGLAVGAVGAFLAEVDGRSLGFTTDSDGTVVDNETGSTWNVSGQATSGPLAGKTLDPVVHLDTFWFAWSRYHPDTAVVG